MAKRRIDRQAARGRAPGDGYQHLDRFLRATLPAAFRASGFPAVAGQLDRIPPLEDEANAVLACRSVAAVAIAHTDLMLRALDALDDEAKAEVLEGAQPLEAIMERLPIK